MGILEEFIGVKEKEGGRLREDKALSR